MLVYTDHEKCFLQFLCQIQSQIHQYNDLKLKLYFHLLQCQNLYSQRLQNSQQSLNRELLIDIIYQ